MPYKANEARRHKIPRARYRVTQLAGVRQDAPATRQPYVDGPRTQSVSCVLTRTALARRRERGQVMIPGC